jgi:hypothetical protein
MEGLYVYSNSTDGVNGAEPSQCQMVPSQREPGGNAYPNAREAGIPSRGSETTDRSGREDELHGLWVRDLIKCLTQTEECRQAQS